MTTLVDVFEIHSWTRVHCSTSPPRQTRLRSFEALFDAVIAFDETLHYMYMQETSDVSLKKFYIYILYSLKDYGYYIGFSANLKARLQTHAHGQVTATKFRRPFKLIHYEYFINRTDALAREKFLKSGFGRSQMKKMLQSTMGDLPNTT